MKLTKASDKITLNNGHKIPCIGYGTWQSPNDDTTVEAVKNAINAGYTHIDTASFYKNEESVSKAIKESSVKREDLFVTSKLWNSDRGYEKTLKAFEKTMKNLDMEYLDLYLIHWPAIKKQFDNWEEINLQTWKAMEKLYKEGRIKAIGVSNFQPKHLKGILENGEIKPQVDQIEFHPGFTQYETLDFCKKEDILVEAWSPLGNGDVLKNEQLNEIANKLGKSVAQVCIKWNMQNGILPLPKSMNKTRMKDNLDVFDFEISEDDMNIINDIPYCGGQGSDSDDVDF